MVIQMDFVETKNHTYILLQFTVHKKVHFMFLIKFCVSGDSDVGGVCAWLSMRICLCFCMCLQDLGRIECVFVTTLDLRYPA